MKPETRQKLREINRDVPDIIKAKAVEKVKKVKDPVAVYAAVIEIVIILALAISAYIWENPKINLIPDQVMPFWQKTIVFAVFCAIAILLFQYNKKFFSQTAKDTQWVWRWKNKP